MRFPAYACGVAISIAAACLPTTSFAHAIVLKSSLSAYPIKPRVAGSITLYFNSRIEVKLSRAVLVSRDHTERGVALVAGKSAGEVVVELPPLEPGNYAVRYRVLAADGHVTAETLRFSIAP